MTSAQNEDLSYILEYDGTTSIAIHKNRIQLFIIFRRFVRNKLAVLGLMVLLVIAAGALLAPAITHQTASIDPANDTHIAIALQGPSSAHLLGTDDVGRDEFARLLFGARISLLVGFISMIISLLVSVLVGAIAGYYGGWVDNILMRITDAFLTVPFYLLLFVLSVSFSNGGVLSVVLLIAGFSWANTTRVVRGQFFSLKTQEFVLAMRALGARDVRIMLWHILPNASGPIIVSATLQVGYNIITESTLSFFNFGIQPPQASWGAMLASSQDYASSQPILVFAPGLIILITVLCLNFLGDGLRDALDPHMTER